MIRTAQPDELPTLCSIAAASQRDPATHSAYVGVEADGIRAEIEAIVDWPGVSAVAEVDGIVAWIVGEIEPELGRVWWIGPFGSSTSWDALLDHAQGLLPPGIDQEEFAVDERASGLAAWIVGRGFERQPGSAILSAQLPLAPSRTVPTRPITPGDRATIGSLHAELFPNSHMTARQLVEEGDTNHLRLVAEADGTPVGYIAVERQPDGSGYVDFLGVCEAERGKGYAKGLIGAGARLLEDLGCSRIHLSVRETNVAARTLYVSLGFTEERVIVPLRKGFGVG